MLESLLSTLTLALPWSFVLIIKWPAASLSVTGVPSSLKNWTCLSSNMLLTKLSNSSEPTNDLRNSLSGPGCSSTNFSSNPSCSSMIFNTVSLNLAMLKHTSLGSLLKSCNPRNSHKSTVKLYFDSLIGNSVSPKYRKCGNSKQASSWISTFSNATGFWNPSVTLKLMSYPSPSHAIAGLHFLFDSFKQSQKPSHPSSSSGSYSIDGSNPAPSHMKL